MLVQEEKLEFSQITSVILKRWEFHFIGERGYIIEWWENDLGYLGDQKELERQPCKWVKWA